MDLETPIDECLYHSGPVSLKPLPPPSEPTSQINWPRMSDIFHSKLSKQVVRSNLNHAAIAPSASAIETLQNWTAILMVLYWRMFQQSTVWAVFCYLLHKGTVDLECLFLPLDFFELSPNTHIITDLLLCFPSIQGICEQRASDRVPLQTSPWLAAVIARNGANIPDIPRNKHDAEKEAEKDYNCQVFGVWLPHGIGEDYELCRKRLHEHLTRAKEIADAYDQTLGEQHRIILVLLEDVEGTMDVGKITTGEVSCILPVIQIFPYAEDLEMMAIEDSDTESEGQKDTMPSGFWD
ncbi:uncharacterized protein N7483_011181 [Penicillium malachiteum]|uniref:uncharacterized protein n=1 Tax=Penicillium malachiteum TaxID=1324776 RepID=UPI002549A2BF|nr:uncharacterized protein N7483_011181 [Penicillium malachiteum]KAJ5714000.1 hypothetical protein N7483_011181 [Penicillium malachiteum]